MCTLRTLLPFVLLVVLHIAWAVNTQRSYGPYDFLLHHMEECKNTGLGNIRASFKTRRVGHNTYSLDAQVMSKVVVDDKCVAKVSAAVLTNGGYKDNFWTRDFPGVCTMGKIFIAEILEHLGRAAGHPEMSCPIPVGNYTIKKLNVVFQFKEVPMFFYNKYRVDVAFMKHDKVQGCISLFADVQPKKTKG